MRIDLNQNHILGQLINETFNVFFTKLKETCIFRPSCKTDITYLTLQVFRNELFP